MLLMVVLVICIIMSCESWCSYCFYINNRTNDSIVIKTTSLISNYKIQITNYIIRNPNEHGYNVYIDNPTDTVFTIPPQTTFFASIGWYSRQTMKSTPEKDGVVPLWTIIKAMIVNDNDINPIIWNNEQKWGKQVLDDNTSVKYELNLLKYGDSEDYFESDQGTVIIF